MEKATERHSKQRELILAQLSALSTHPTADELYQLVRQKMPNISLGTVYRNLDFLAAKNLLRKFNDGKKTRFDGNVKPHAHLNCLNCGCLKDLPQIAIDQLDNFYQKIDNFKILSYQLTFIGICNNCNQKSNKKELKNVN